MVKASDLYRFLREIDEDFSPSLSSKVTLFEYVEKIQNKAELIIDIDNNIIRGLVVLYCNNLDNRNAYISLVGVKKDYRGRGIARNLMKDAIKIAKDKGMKILGIHSNNPAALNIYKTLGFETKDFGEREYLELKL